MIRLLPASKVVTGDTLVLNPDSPNSEMLSVYGIEVDKKEVVFHAKERQDRPLRVKAAEQVAIVVDGAAMLRRSDKAHAAHVDQRHLDEEAPEDGGEEPLPQGETLGPVEPPAVWRRTPVFDDMVQEYGYDPLEDRLTEFRWAPGIPGHAAGVHARE